MRLRFPRASIFVASILAGLAIGYVPIMRVFDGYGMRVPGGGVIDTRTTLLRGVIKDVNMESQTLTLIGVSPFSPEESAPFRVTFDKVLTILSTPPTPGYPNQFLMSPNVKEIDATGLVVGAPVTVRINRTPGPLQASWIAVREPLY